MQVVGALSDASVVTKKPLRAADYRPRQAAPEKMKRAGNSLTLQWSRQPTYLPNSALSALKSRILIGFAAETEKTWWNSQPKACGKHHQRGM